jgi:muconolactone delta-isomerase
MLLELRFASEAGVRSATANAQKSHARLGQAHKSVARSRDTRALVGRYFRRTAKTKEETVQYFVQFDVHQPTTMSRDELFEIWLEEARAAQEAMDAGVVTNLWKVIGQRSVFAVLDVPDHTSVDQALESLPIIQKLGGSVDTHLYAIRPYGEWAEELRIAVEGK